MANPFEFNGNDPLNYGMMAAGGALMTPVKQGGGFGPAATTFERTVSAERQNEIDAQLKKLLIETRRSALKSGEGLPANVRTALWYSSASPEQKKAFEFSVRNNTVKGPNGELYAKEADGTLRRLTKLEETLVEKEALSSADQWGKEIPKAATDLVTGTNAATNRPEQITRLDQLQRMGLGTVQRPGLSAFNPAAAMAGPPAAMPPQLQREMPPGLTPQQQQNGLSMPELVNQTRGQLQNPFGGPPLPPITQAPLLPPAAGAPALAAEQTKLQEKEKYDAKLREEYPKAKGSINALENTLDNALKQVDLVAKNKTGGDWNTGLISNLPTRIIKGTPPYQHATDLQTLQDQMVVETIKSMKELSKTGATGFGSLSEKEGSRLQNAVGNLQIGQRKDDFDRAVENVKNVIKDIKKNARSTFETEFGKFHPSDDPLGIR
jgi:hypothetical protein